MMASVSWHCVSVPAFCPYHTNKRQEFYCKTCEEPVCQQCIAEEHKLPKHKREEIEKTTKKYQEKLESLLPMKAKLVEDFDSSVTNIGNTLLRLESSRLTCANDVDKQYKKAELFLKEKRQELIEDLEQKFKNKRDVLSDQRARLLAARSEAVSAIHFVQRVKWYDDHKTAFGDANDCYRKMKEALSRELQLRPEENCRIYFEENNELGEIICSTMLGEIETTSSVGFTSCLTCTDFQDVRIGSLKILKLIARNAIDEQVNEGGADVEAELIYQDTEMKLETKDNNDGTYSIYIRPEKAGEASLSVNMFGIPIKHSPFKIKVKPANHLVLKFTHEVFKEKGPFGVAVSHKGEIFIVNRTSNVYVFDRDGKLKKTLGVNGAKYLQGIIVSNDETFIVTDNQIREIFKCDKNGQVIKRFGADVLEDPVGVTEGHDKCVYVVDYEGHCIQKFKPGGQYVKRFIHSKPGDAISPWFITTSTSNNRFIISDTWAHYIHVFDNNGNALFRFGSYGKLLGQLEYPKGVAVDKENNILVSSEHRVQLFSSTGAYKWRIDDESHALRDPRGIAIIPGDWRRVVVADWGNRLVKIFNY